MANKRKKIKVFLFVLIGILTISVGYASISAINLIINGNATANVNQNNFKVHFTQAQAITGTTGVSGTSTIDAQDDTKAMFDVPLAPVEPVILCACVKCTLKFSWFTDAVALPLIIRFTALIAA